MLIIASIKYGFDICKSKTAGTAQRGCLALAGAAAISISAFLRLLFFFAIGNVESTV
jgi:hypothetical protein